MGEYVLVGASTRTYKIHPIEVAWHFSPDVDKFEDFSNVLMIVGKIEGEAFIPMDIVAITASIRPYFRSWGTGNHFIKEKGATHFAIIGGDELRRRVAQDDLDRAYPRM